METAAKRSWSVAVSGSHLTIPRKGMETRWRSGRLVHSKKMSHLTIPRKGMETLPRALQLDAWKVALNYSPQGDGN